MYASPVRITRVFALSKIFARTCLLLALAGAAIRSGQAADPFGAALNAPTLV